VTIGLPQALGYHYYGPLLTTFLRDLDIEIIMSGPTDRSKLDQGINIAPGETCLPVKCYLGHALSLATKAERILVPRLVCLRTKPGIRLGCPKMIGLPDMISALLPDVSIVTLNVDLRQQSEEQSYVRFARELGSSEQRARRAYAHGTEIAKESRQEMISVTRSTIDSNGDLKIGMLGHAYLLYDDFLNIGIIKKTCEAGATIINCHECEATDIDDAPGSITPLSWYFENQMISAARHFRNDARISGIVYLCSFGCGAASITSEVIETEVECRHTTHTLKIVLDEHTGETGVATRIESFIDMLNLRKGRMR
jgi:predicted nucleotide-binding protein (sugar kinase/HSP70/actin superfamily)